MIEPYPHYTKIKVTESDVLPTTQGWEQNLYKINSGKLALEKEILNFDREMFIEHIRLIKGKIRVYGAQEPGWLQIAIIRGHDGVFFGVADTNEIAMILHSEHSWDATEEAPTSSFTLNIPPEITDLILPPEKEAVLSQSDNSEETTKSIIFPITGSIADLERLMKKLMVRARKSDFPTQDAHEHDQIRQELIGLASDVIDDFLAERNDLFLSSVYENRRYLARQIERDLWQLTPDQDEDEFTLDYFASNMQISRRTIQLAIQENFNTSFSKLKRAIRLHQIRSMLTKRVSGKTIGDYALAHGFKNWGRLSAYYRDLFGIYPKNTDVEDE